MRKSLSLLIPVFVAPMLALGQHNITIKGKVDNFVPGDKMSVIQRGDYASVTLAEAPINEDGTYVMNVTVDKPGTANLMCGNYDRVMVWLEDEDFGVDFAGRDTSKMRMIMPKMIEIKGGPKSEVMNWANYLSIRSHNDMMNIYNSVKCEGVEQSRLDSIRGRLMDASRESMLGYARRLVREKQNITSVLALLPSLSAKEDSALIEETLDAVIAANPSSVVAQNYRKERAERQALERAVAVGSPAPDLTLTDLKGKTVKLSSLKGKVLIVDFWASWCGPCRAEIPKLKAIYEDFKDNKRVAFVSVSIDKDKDAWLKAVEKENMPWMQLLAPNGGQDALKSYQFSGIPFIICIAEDGTIFRKRLRGDAVRDAIGEALAR